MLNAIMQKCIFACGEDSKNWSSIPTNTLPVTSVHVNTPACACSPTLLAALHIYVKSKNLMETEDGFKVAIADTPLFTIVELQKEGSQIEAIVYQKVNGTFQSVDNNLDTGAMNTYILGTKSGQHRGVAILLALIPTILTDNEALSDFSTLENELLDPGNMTSVHFNALARLTASTIGRLKSTTTASIKFADSMKNGTMPTLTELNIPTYAPDTSEVLIGRFILFNKSGAGNLAANISLSNFVGAFPLNPNRVYSEEEEILIPTLPSYYVVPEEIVEICECAVESTSYNESMRNFMLEGPAGTGKTKGAQAIASALTLPYTHVTCHAGSEIFDFIGTIFPATEDSKELNYDDLLAQHDFPTFEEVEFDLEDSYKRLTGETTLPVGFDKIECYTLLTMKLLEVVRQSYLEGKDYVYTETNLIKAIKNGWVCEIQEPTVIVQPGVLVGLNSLLEQNGSITLPTGEVIQRHPDTVIVITTNTEYEGCRDINQSVISRMDLVVEMELPMKDVLIDRAIAQTGCSDIVKITAMVEVMLETAEHCRQRDITDGSCGPRELYAWIKADNILKNPIKTCRTAFLNKVTRNKEDREEIYDTIISLKSYGI